jgi:transcriptional regulator with GAF, ATPase, and Fis domain
LLLDEIGDLSLEAQGALLRFLQSGEIQPVGSSKPVKVDARVIAATNRDLREDVEAGRFRKDLFHRLNVITLWVPPLRLRTDDIPVLARHFARRHSELFEMPEVFLADDEIRDLVDRDWEGNVRELENCIKRRVLFGRDAEDLSGQFDERMYENRRLVFTQDRIPSDERRWSKLSKDEKQRRLADAWDETGGNVTLTARRLGISRRTVQRMRHAFNVGKTPTSEEGSA